MKYILHTYDYESKPCKSITPLDESGEMHGEQKIYVYAHKCVPTNLDSLNLRGWNHIASRVYEHGHLVAEKAFDYDTVDITFTRNPERVKYTVQFEYKPDDVCIVSSYVNEYLMEQITKVCGIIQGPREIYVWEHDSIRTYGGQRATYITYTYVDGIKHGPVVCASLLTGKLITSYTYLHGKKHGEYNEYYKSGLLRKQYIYNRGEYEECSSYHDHGTLCEREIYKNGLPYIGCRYYFDGKTIASNTESNEIMSPKQMHAINYTYDGDVEDEDTYTEYYYKRSKCPKDIQYCYMGCKYNTVIEQPNLVLPTRILKSRTLYTPNLL